MALKSARIVDLCCKSSGFADFENKITADRGSAVIFEADSGLCPSYVRILGPKRNLDQKSFFSLDRHVNVHPNYFFFRKKFILSQVQGNQAVEEKMTLFFPGLKQTLLGTP